MLDYRRKKLLKVNLRPYIASLGLTDSVKQFKINNYQICLILWNMIWDYKKIKKMCQNSEISYQIIWNIILGKSSVKSQKQFGVVALPKPQNPNHQNPKTPKHGITKTPKPQNPESPKPQNPKSPKPQNPMAQFQNFNRISTPFRGSDCDHLRGSDCEPLRGSKCDHLRGSDCEPLRGPK